MTTSNAEVLLSDARVPESLRANLKFFLRCLRRVLREYDVELLAIFDELLGLMFAANRGDEDPEGSTEAFLQAAQQISDLDVRASSLVMRAFATFFHLANICEERHRNDAIRALEGRQEPTADGDPANALTLAFGSLRNQLGEDEALYRAPHRGKAQGAGRKDSPHRHAA